MSPRAGANHNHKLFYINNKSNEKRRCKVSLQLTEGAPQRPNGLEPPKPGTRPWPSGLGPRAFGGVSDSVQEPLWQFPLSTDIASKGAETKPSR